jgi:hypothetical protein
MRTPGQAGAQHAARLQNGKNCQIDPPLHFVLRLYPLCFCFSFPRLTAINIRSNARIQSRGVILKRTDKVR